MLAVYIRPGEWFSLVEGDETLGSFARAVAARIREP